MKYKEVEANTLLEEKNHVKYLGILMDNNLNWKSHASYIAKKIKRSIGILSKLRYYVTLDTLITLYFALLYPFLIYGILIWGNTYPTNIKPLFILQKRAIRLITFSKFDEHTSPLFKIIGIHAAYIRMPTRILFSMFQIFITLCTSIQSHAICLTIKVSRHIKWLIELVFHIKNFRSCYPPY